MIMTMTVAMVLMSRFKPVRRGTQPVARTSFSVCRTKSVSEKIARVIPTTRPIIGSTVWMGQTRMPKCVLKSNVPTRTGPSSARELLKHLGVSQITGLTTEWTTAKTDSTKK